MMFPKKKRCQAFRALRVDNSTSTITVNRSLPEHQTGDPDSFRYDIPLAHVGAAMVKVEITVAFGGQSQSRTGGCSPRPRARPSSTTRMAISSAMPAGPMSGTPRTASWPWRRKAEPQVQRRAARRASG
jgi:hypothetical protein